MVCQFIFHYFEYAFFCSSLQFEAILCDVEEELRDLQEIQERKCMKVGTHNKLYCFEKLDTVANFSNWKFYMEIALKLEDLWTCVLETNDDDAK